MSSISAGRMLRSRKVAVEQQAELPSGASARPANGNGRRSSARSADQWLLGGTFFVSELSSGGSLISVWLRERLGRVQDPLALGAAHVLADEAVADRELLPARAVELLSTLRHHGKREADDAEHQQHCSDDADDLARHGRCPRALRRRARQRAS